MTTVRVVGIRNLTNPEDEQEASKTIVKRVKRPRREFESDFESLNEDGSLRIKVAPFDPQTAWKATKLASGDISD